MSWTIPAIIATLIGTLMLAIVYFLIYVRERQRYLGIWTISWGLYGVRFLFTLLMDFGYEYRALLAAEHIAALLSGAFLLWGTLLFINVRRVSWIAVAAVLDIIWIVGAMYLQKSFVTLALPTYLFLGVAYIITGVALLRDTSTRVTGRVILGVSFILWGLHKTDYPFLRLVEYLAPWGFILGATLQMAVALGLLLVFFDRARQQVIESEARYRAVFENASCGIAVRDLSGRYLYCNEYWHKLTGYRADELRGIQEAHITHPDDVEAAQDYFDRLRRGKIPHYRMQKRLIRKDRRELWCDCSANPIRNELGRVVSLCDVIVDITAIQQTREELERSRARLRTIIDSSNDCLLILGGKDEFEIVDVNPATLDTFGYTREQLLGRAVHTLQSPGAFADLKSDLETAISVDGFWRGTWTMLAADGRQLVMETTVSPMRKDPVIAQRWVAVMRDVSEQRREHEILEKYQLLARHSRDAILFVDAHTGVIREVNAAAVSTYGFMREQFLEMNYRDLRRDGGEEAALRDESVREGLRYEALHHRADDTFFPVEISALEARIGEDRLLLLVVRDITEQKRAEQKLRQEQLKNQALVDVIDRSPAVAITWRGTERWPVEFVTDNVRQFGYSPAQLTRGRPGLPDIIHPDDVKWVVRHLEEAATGGTPHVELELRIIARDDSIHWLDMRVWIDPKRIDAAPLYHGVMLDITGRKRAELTVQTSEARFRTMLQNVELVAITLDTEGKVTFANDYLLRLTGWQREDIVGQNWFESPMRPGPQAREVFERSVRTGGIPAHVEHDIHSKDGECRHIRWNNTFLRAGDGQIIGTAAIGEDVTEHRRAVEMQSRLAAIVQSSTDAIIGNAPDGLITSWNRSAERMFGYTADEITGQSIAVLVPEERGPELQWILDKIQHRESIVNHETQRLTKYGKLIDVALTISPISDGHGHLIGASIIVRDLTGHRRQQRERDTLEAQLRQSQKMEAVGRLAGGVAHDFNNILTGITGYADMILRRLDQNDSVFEDVQQIRHASERAAALTKQLLAFSRKQLISPEILQISTVVENAHRMLERVIGEDLQLELQTRSDLYYIKADPGQIDQVLLNLVVNSRDALPEGGRIVIETVNATVDEEFCAEHTFAKPGEYVKLVVRDNGTGMDETTLEHIFEPFFTTKERGKGTGLGLATVFGIVKQNNGFVLVDSDIDVGTTVRIYLPAVEKKPDDVTSFEPIPPSKGGETVLLVEDEEMLRTLVKKILELNGYRVLVADTGADALALATKNADGLDLLLTDVIMPGMNGKELYERITEFRPDLRVLFMSGYTAEVIARHGVLEEGVAFIEKPFNVDDLAKKVREVLDTVARPDRFATEEEAPVS
ncbi:MAG: PAS domain S-box protein [Candidatus Lernaella stagnicola]|nr:PAS domain S-box protein [Candidatus Lernaella stagnicola]